MAMVALIMRPWVLLMRTYLGIRCFILADDVLIVATGKQMASKFGAALNATHLYLHTMGAKVAPSKSYNFATSAKVKAWIKNVKWDNIEEDIQVVADFMYLGAHINANNATSSGTLDERLDCDG